MRKDTKVKKEPFLCPYKVYQPKNVSNALCDKSSKLINLKKTYELEFITQLFTYGINTSEIAG